MSDPTTVDGAPIELGDVVWRVDACGVRQIKMQKHHLGTWWSWLSKELYATETTALAAAIANERMCLKKAQREVSRAQRAIARLKARQAGDR